MIGVDMLFSVGESFARILSEADGSSVQDLCEQCADYYDVNTALPPGPAEAQSMFLALPEGRDYKDKLLLGIFADEKSKMFGLMDVIKGYPDSGTWTLGLFLLAPEMRGKGFGQKFYLAFEKWAKQNGAKSIRIGVIENNDRGLEFWQKLKFRQIERKAPYTFGKRESALLVLIRDCQ